MTTFHEHDGTLRVCHRHEVLLISAWGADSVRVRAAQYRIPTESIGALDEAPAGGTPVVSIGDGRATLVNGELTVEVDADLEAAYPEPLLTFRRTSTGDVLLAEQREHEQAEELDGVLLGVAVPRGEHDKHASRPEQETAEGRDRVEPHGVEEVEAVERMTVGRHQAGQAEGDEQRDERRVPHIRVGTLPHGTAHEHAGPGQRQDELRRPCEPGVQVDLTAL